MSFLSPLAFAFAATIPVVIVFYLLKRKRTVKLVSSTLLWQKFLAETQANAPFQRLRHNWLLILQILLLALIVLALTRPYFSGKSRSSQLRVLILDASASMQATDVSPSRFEKARAEALKWVDALGDYDQMVVLQAGGSTEVKQSSTSEKAALRRAIRDCKVADSPTRLTEALKLADTLIRGQTGAEIHLFSDGAIPGLEELENRALPLVFHRIGERSENLAVTTLDVRANPDDPRQRAVFLNVANYATNAMSADAELLLDGQLIERRAVTVGPTNSSPQVFVASQSQAGVFSVRLNLNDDLAADNQASIVSLLPQPVKVLLVSRGNRLLEKALRAVPNVELATASDCATPGTGFDFVVIDDLQPTVWPAVNTLAIHAAPTNWFEEAGRIEGPAIVDWKSAHPLLRYVNLDNVQVAETLRVKPPNWAVALVDSPQTPLLLAGERGRQRVVWIGFDTLQSTWPLRISFPIFIANAVEWLNPAAVQASLLMVRAGDPFRLTPSQAVNEVQVTAPDGAVRTLPVDPNAREIVFGDTQRQGIYRLRAGTNDTVFCANLLDSMESNIAPRSELPLGKYGRAAESTLSRANLETWRWIAMAGLAVLLFEWWFYHRRTA